MRSTGWRVTRRWRRSSTTSPKPQVDGQALGWWTKEEWKRFTATANGVEVLGVHAFGLAEARMTTTDASWLVRRVAAHSVRPQWDPERKLPDDAVRYYIDTLAADPEALRGSSECYRTINTWPVPGRTGSVGGGKSSPAHLKPGHPCLMSDVTLQAIPAGRRPGR